MTSSNHNKNKSSNHNLSQTTDHAHKGTHLVVHRQLPGDTECHLGSSIPREAAAQSEHLKERPPSDCLNMSKCSDTILSF